MDARPKLMEYAQRQLGFSQADSDDFVQEVSLKFARRVQSGSVDDRNPPSFMRKLSYFHAKDFRRKRARQRTGHVDVDDPTAVIPGTTRPSPEQTTLHRRELAAVARATMSPTDAIVLLGITCGDTEEATCARLEAAGFPVESCTRASVKQHRHDIRQRLRALP